MAWTRQQTAVYVQAAGSGTLSLTANITATTANNLLILGFIGTSAPSFSYTGGGTPVETAAITTSTPVSAGLWFIPSCPSGITQVSATQSAFGACALVVGEYHDSNGSNSTPLDVTVTNDNGFGTANPWTSGTTTTLAGISELAIGLGIQWRAVVGTLTATGSWSANGTPLASTSAGEPALILQDILGTGSTTGVAATGTFSAVGSQQVQGFAATFKPAATGGGGNAFAPGVLGTTPLSIFIQTDDIFWKAN